MKKNTKVSAAGLLLAVATLATALAPVSSSAAPVTVYFQGVSTTYRDNAGTVIAAKSGLGFSGWLTFDTALAESSNSFSSPFMTHASATTSRSCLSVVNGVCTNDYGNGAPVVLDYRVFAPFAPAGSYYALNHDGADWFDSTWRENTRLAPGVAAPDGSDTYSVGRLEQRTVLEGEVPSGLYTVDGIAQDINLALTTSGTALLTHVLDLDAAPDFAAVPLGQENFIFEYTNATSRVCPTCPNDYRLTVDSFSFGGSLTSFYVLPGMPVPEPSSFALTVVALLGGVIGARRRGHLKAPNGGRVAESWSTDR